MTEKKAVVSASDKFETSHPRVNSRVTSVVKVQTRVTSASRLISGSFRWVPRTTAKQPSFRTTSRVIQIKKKIVDLHVEGRKFWNTEQVIQPLNGYKTKISSTKT